MKEWIAHLAVMIFFACLFTGTGWLIGLGLPTGYEFLIFCMIGNLIIKKEERAE